MIFTVVECRSKHLRIIAQKASIKSITSGSSWGTLHAGTKIFLRPFQ